MKLNYSWLALFSILFVLLTNGAKRIAFAASDGLPVDRITLPAGFEIKLYAQVPNARSMTLSPNGTLFVGSRSGGKVYAIQTRDEGAQIKTPLVVAERLNMSRLSSAPPM